MQSSSNTSAHSEEQVSRGANVLDPSLKLASLPLEQKHQDLGSEPLASNSIQLGFSIIFLRLSFSSIAFLNIHFCTQLSCLVSDNSI